jgi:hypothetical protein
MELLLKVLVRMTPRLQIASIHIQMCLIRVRQIICRVQIVLTRVRFLIWKVSNSARYYCWFAQYKIWFGIRLMTLGLRVQQVVCKSCYPRMKIAELLKRHRANYGLGDTQGAKPLNRFELWLFGSALAHIYNERAERDGLSPHDVNYHNPANVAALYAGLRARIG